MTPYQAIIFDMDGVIVDSEPLHDRAWLDLFHALGYGDRHGIHFPDYYGRSDSTLGQDFIDLHQLTQPLAELVTWKQRRFIELIRERRPVFAPLPPLVAKLAARYRLGVASGSPPVVIREVMAMAGLQSFFPVAVSVYDVGKNKPAPDVFLQAAALLETDPSRCCVVEDAAVGVEGALAAGMAVIAITNSLPRERLARATHIVSAYDEIERLLLPAGDPNG